MLSEKISTTFLLFLNFISFAMIIGLIVGMINLDAKVASMKEIASINPPISLSVDKKQEGNQQVENNPRKSAGRELIISDQGYSPSGIQIYGNEITTIKILNSNSSPHSFVIDELNIDSGLIAPGETKEIIIDKEFPQSKSYTFRSNAEGDDPQTFTGVLMVIK